MAICRGCGIEKTGFFSDYCNNCIREQVAFTQSPKNIPPPTAETPATPIQERGSATSTHLNQAEESNSGLLKFIGFVLGFSVVAGIEVALLSAIGGTPRGLGWIVLPFVAAFAFSKSAPSLFDNISRSGGSLWRTSKNFRLVAVLSTLWLVSVPTYILLFEYGFDSFGYSEMFKVMLFPVLVLAAGYFAYAKFVVATPGQDDA